MERKYCKTENPLRLSFLWMSLICCIVLSLCFFYISYISYKDYNEQWAQDKADLAINDLEIQVEMMEVIAARISSNYEFHPNYFRSTIANELAMLKTFQQFQFYTPLTEEYFLYYGGDRIYRSTGTTLDMDVFLEFRMNTEQEREHFRSVLYDMKAEGKLVHNQLQMLPTQNEIFVLIPFRVNEGGKMTNAILFMGVNGKVLFERFQAVSGHMQGNISLFRDEKLIYSNGNEVCTSIDKNTVVSVSQDGIYKMCYQPSYTNKLVTGLLLPQFLLIIIDAILILGVANLFAVKAYSPLKGLTERYRDDVEPADNAFSNVYEELDYMLNKMIQFNMDATQQIQQRQQLLKKQILRILLEGKSSGDVLFYMDKVGIHFTGPLFYVISISFEHMDEVTEEFLEKVQSALEKISDTRKQEYIYTVSILQKKLIYVICNICVEEKKMELAEIVGEVAGSFGFEPSIGVGSTCGSVLGLTASWMESMDEIYNRQNSQGEGFIYDSNKMRKIFCALEIGDERSAMEQLDNFAAEFANDSVSLLMQQFILSDFLSEYGKLARKYQIELEKKDMSALIATTNINDFVKEVGKIIHEFCEIYEKERTRIREEDADRVIEYIEQHFAEQDISMEKVALEMNVTMNFVREAVLVKTGKMYKEYLIYLRIEYAKDLLCNTRMQVAEVCQKVGYINISYFIAIFREATGVTPAKYRKIVETYSK